MEEKFLYLDAGIKPIDCRDGYKDYLLSDILSAYHLSCTCIKMRYEHDNIIPRTNADILMLKRSGRFVADIFLSDGSVVSFSPLHHILDSQSRDVSPLYPYDDLVLRYGYEREPIWVAAIVCGLKHNL